MKTFVGKVSCRLFPADLGLLKQRYDIHNELQVVSNRMVKSVLVSVARWKVFPKYKLRKRWTKKFMVRL